MEKKKEMMKEEKQIINYIIFGDLTTLINFLIFYILDKNNIDYKTNTTIVNFISILFAFKSKVWKLKFLLSRLGTYFLDILGMIIFISILSFICMFFIIFVTMYYGVTTPGYSSLVVMVLFLGGLQLLCLGIRGEYLGRVFYETKGRPLYFVNEYSGEKE